MANEKMHLRGFSWNRDGIGDKLQDIEHEQPWSDCSKGKEHFGMPVTERAYVEMIKKFRDYFDDIGTDNPFINITYVDFSKASILRILAQEDCEFIRISFAMPEKGPIEASAALQGLNKNGKPVKEDEYNDTVEAVEASKEVISEEVTGIFKNGLKAQYEERGNGGRDSAAVKLLSVEYEEFKNKFTDTDLSFKSFVQNLYRDVNK